MVEAAVAPKMAEGLVIDLKDAQRVAALKLLTSTPGLTLEVFGASGTTPPPAITDHGWTHLAKARVIEKKDKPVEIKLGHHTNSFRYILVWLTRAPESAVGSPTAPGQVDLNEVELFAPPKS